MLYEALGRLAPSPVVELNRAVAMSMAQGPAAALRWSTGWSRRAACASPSCCRASAASSCVAWAVATTPGASSNAPSSCAGTSVSASAGPQARRARLTGGPDRPSLGRRTARSVDGMAITLTLNNGTDARPRLRRLPDPTRRDRAPCAPPSRSATGRSTPPPPTATSVRSARRSCAVRVGRDEVFVETKVWISDYGYDATLHAFDKSAGKLGVDTDRPADPAPGAAQPVRPDDRGLPRAGEAAGRREGSARSASATSCPSTSTSCSRTASVVPAVNQIEVHPYFRSRTCWRRTPSTASHPGVVADRRHHVLPGGGRRSTFDDPTITGIADAHGRSPAQVMLRWHLQQGRSAIPKSVTPDADRGELRRLRLRLSDDELAAIDALDTGRRGGPEPDAVTLEAFGREIPEA